MIYENAILEETNETRKVPNYFKSLTGEPTESAIYRLQLFKEGRVEKEFKALGKFFKINSDDICVYGPFAWLPNEPGELIFRVAMKDVGVFERIDKTTAGEQIAV